MESGWLAAGVAILGFIATLLGGAMRLSNLRSQHEKQLADIREESQRHLREMDDRIRKARDVLEQRFREIDQAISVNRSIFGEGIASVRQKANDVELLSFKTFVRRDSFMEIIQKYEATAKSYRDEIAARMERFEAKLDTILSQR